MLRDLVVRNRSYRRFDQEFMVETNTLEQLVELTRFCPSGRNLQPLKYALVNTPEKCKLIFPALAWAGYLKDWDGPAEGERPTAYIVMLEDQNISSSSQWDQGIAAQTILLGAVDKGLGGCIIASVNKKMVEQQLQLPDHLKVVLVIAIGYPVEKVVVDDLHPGGSIEYWRDSAQVHHVPKRPLSELIWRG